MSSPAAGAVLGTVGGAALATTMALGSAGAGAKAGAAVGVLAGPVGVAVGGVVGGAAGYASYYVAKGISSLFSDGESIQHDEEKNSDTENDRNEDVDRDDDKQQDNDADEDDKEEEEESSGSEDEIEEESTESSNYETYLSEILDRIQRLPRDAPVETRMSLFQELCDALNPVFYDTRNRVRIDRTTRDLVISIPGYRNIHLLTLIRDNLGLFNIEDLGSRLDLVDEQEQALVYLLRCRHCSSNYVGLSTHFPDRHSTHRSNIKRGKNSSPNKHLDRHRQQTGTQLTFQNSFEVIFLRGLPSMLKEMASGKTIKKILRSWEVFLQWLLKGRQHDGGIGRR